MVLTDEVRNKVHKLIQSGLSRKEAINICDRELDKNMSACYYYTFKGYKVEICPRNSMYVDNFDAGQAIWESNIHFPNSTVVSVGSYATQLEAALMAERTINQWA